MADFNIAGRLDAGMKLKYFSGQYQQLSDRGDIKFPESFRINYEFHKNLKLLLASQI